MPPSCVWASLRRALRRWAPPQGVTWELCPDLEAAAPPSLDAGCCEVAEQRSIFWGDEKVADRVIKKSLFRGLLVSLWVYMIHTMVQFMSDHKSEFHNDDQGLGIAIFLLVLIVACVTPYFFFADKIFDDYTKQV